MDDDLTQWRLKRNCSLTPQQAGWFFLLLCVLSMSVGLFFWLQGAKLVMLFTALELMATCLRESPEPVTLVPTGPLTNIALLLAAHPAGWGPSPPYWVAVPAAARVLAASWT